MILPLVISSLAFSWLSATAYPLVPRQSDPSSGLASCFSLLNLCNSSSPDISNPFANTACVLYMTCEFQGGNIASLLANIGAPANPPRLSESTFKALSNGSDVMTQQNYIDAYYGQISKTPNGTYPSDASFVIYWWASIAAWTGFCDTLTIPYSNFADWLEYSSVPGVCPAVQSCTGSVTTPVCVPQPITDNGSCAEIANECEVFAYNGLFQNEFCVLASMCYAQAPNGTDTLILNTWPSYVSNPPTSKTSARLSQAVFNSITKGSSTMSQQNVIDAYYYSLTGTWVSLGGPWGAYTPGQTSNNGPYPTTSDYISSFWDLVSAWTGFCDTKEIPYSNLADYFQYAATSGYHPTC